MGRQFDHFKRFAFVCALGSALWSCQGNNSDSGVTIDPAATVCQANSAEILVRDGYFQTMCGCAEGAGSIFTQPTPVTCTVPNNTMVLFVFEGSTRGHELISTGTPAFVSSPLWDPPNGNTESSIYSFQFTSAGTYTFLDAMDEAMTGSIIVKP